MSAADLIFKTYTTQETIYSPVQLIHTYTHVLVTNTGTETLTDVGCYIRPATNVGDVDNPADRAPETDYEDLLTWGTESDLGLAISGGIKLTLPQETGTQISYVTREQGSLLKNKLACKDIAAGETIQISILFEQPPGSPTRRFYIDLVME